MRWFNVGKIVNTHGIKGEVRIISTTDFPESRYKQGNQLTFFSKQNDIQLPLTVRTYRRHKQFDLVRFEEVHTVEEAERLKGGLLKISEQQLNRHELDDGEFYYYEVIGCKVFSEKGEFIGKITEILSPGANDVWVVQATDNGKLHYIPYIESVVKQVNVKEKRVTIHIMEGLIE
ncbi:ribosome maturation factor RimM [Pueribacillus sp. YX66]|uniref:ribosome maturation factor RimM n=1 Tax=Pueribacillus sp. YX66 TaxID=3229242 RepID=UPI00358D6263